MIDRGRGAHMSDFDETENDVPVTPPVLPQPLRKRTLPRERTALAIWFWEIDRVLLSMIAVLIAIGLLAVAAASPVAAQDQSTSKVTLSPLYFFYRQLFFVGLGVPVMLVVSMLPRPQARRFAMFLAAFFMVMLLAVPLIGTSVNGAVRWIGSGWARFQPSEFLKAPFVVTIAWLLSLKLKDRSLPVMSLTFVLTALVAALLMHQPDFGQTVIFCGVWAILLLISGVSMRIMGALGAGAMGLLVLTYLFYENGRERINAFLRPSVDAAAGPRQEQLAHSTITNGGFSGLGPGNGVAKAHLPEAHTDYIFSVIGEEFGLLACMAIALLYLAIITRVLVRLLDEEDNFIILATAGLTAQFGLQALINIGVNVQLLPSKGMTLPFISYGGSSMIALCIGVGLLLAFTRRNPFLSRSSNYVVKWSGR
ncbi:MAG: putative peptidoglycan glycosyltransferase FtsW [Sphingobium sp.]|nr:putative peptidoglycan glycosyltransferase FtsW [Sphingobium sp.]